MRYYDISIDGGSYHFTSHPNGVNSPPDPGALQVEWDMFVLTEAAASAQSYLKIWGIPLTLVSQSSDLNFKSIIVKGGMGKGLPLANPAQSGVMVDGSVINAFGNWIGTNMTLDLIISAKQTDSDAADQKVRNLSVNWKKGTSLQQVLNTTIQQGFPGYKVAGTLNSKLVLNHDEQGFYGTLAQLSQWAKAISKNIIGGTYPGVDMVVQTGKNIMLYDGSSQTSPKQIQFQDLIGQPTWIAPLTLQATCVSRADIRTGDFVMLPQTRTITTTASLSSLSGLRQGSAFTGTFLVTQVRQIGNFRQPDGTSWATILTCAFQAGAQPDVQAPDTAPVPTGGFAAGPSGGVN